MKRLFTAALLVCAPLLLRASSFTNGQAARAEFGQVFFNAAQGQPTSQVLGGPGGVAYSNGILFVADGNGFGAGDTYFTTVGGVTTPGIEVGNRVLMFDTTQLPAPNANLGVGPVSDTLCPVCGFNAINVLGQVDYTSINAGVAQAASSSAAGSMSNPSAVATDGIRLAVADTSNNRVLIWNTIPRSVNTPADVVVGEPNFTTTPVGVTPVASKTTLAGPQGVWIQNGSLYVADTGNNRVLVWNQIPTSNGVNADFVLGQPSLGGIVTPKDPNNPVGSASNLWGPMSVTSDGVRLFVTDKLQNRVLIWNHLPTYTAQPADVVVGQPSMSATIPNNASAVCASLGNDVNNNNAPVYPNRCAATLNYPNFALSDGARLFVADGGNDRVLVYNQIPTSDGASADIVLGQPDFVSDVLAPTGTIDNTGSTDTLASPSSLAFDGTNLYVVDPYNRRVEVFTPGDLHLAGTAVLNAANPETRQEGYVELVGTVVANDTITITLNSATYTYTETSSDTLATITTNIIKAINSSNGGTGDPNAIALTGSAPDTVFFSSKAINLPVGAISLTATSSNTGDVNPIASGVELTGGNAGVAAPGMIIEINYSLTSPTAPGLADNTVSSATCGAGATTVPVAASAALPLSLPASCTGSAAAGSVQVFMDGNPIPLFMVSPTQIKAQVPYEYSNRSTSSLYVRTVHADGSTTITTASPVVLASANPGLFTQTSSANPPPAYQALHQTGNPSVTINVTLSTIQAGDVATITVNGTAFNYTIQASDTLASITANLAKAVSTSIVTATPTGTPGTILISAIQAGAGGAGITVSSTTTPVSGQTSAGVTLSSSNGATCCAVNNSGPITASNPAQPNEVITIYGSGLGPVADSNQNPVNVPDGVPYTGPVQNSSTTSLYASIEGASATVVNASLPPGSIGVYGIQIQLPSALTASTTAPIYVSQNAFVSNTVTIAVQASPATSNQVITASPNPISVAQGVTLGTTTIYWNTTSTAVEVHVGSPSGPLFTTGGSTGNSTTGPWVTNGMVFYLQDASQGTSTSAANTLGTVTVTLVQQAYSGGGGGTGTTGATTAVFPGTCPAPDGGSWVNNNNISFSAQPSTIEVPTGTTFGQTTLNWSIPSGLATKAQVWAVGPGGALGNFASGDSSGQATTGNWVSDGEVFWLQNTTDGSNGQSNADILGCVRVAVQQSAIPVSNLGTLTASPSTIITSGTLGQTTLVWNCPTCTATEIHVNTPTGPLFTSGGKVGSETTGPWVTDGMPFYLLGTVNGSTSVVAVLTVHVQSAGTGAGSGGSSKTGLITATPNPIYYAIGAAPLGQTSLTWSCPACTVTEVHVNSPDGPLFASYPSSGNADTGQWVTDGMVFYLQDATNGNGGSPSNTVATLTVQVLSAAEEPPSTSNGGTISATPDPVPVANGTNFGITTLTWDCSTCTTTEVHVNSPSGPLFAGGTSSGSGTTGQWVTDGMTFYLQDSSNGNSTDPSNTKGTITVWLSPPH